MKRYRDMNLLHPDFRPMADRLVSRCVEERIGIVVVETWRTQEAHEEDIRNKRSWVRVSKHQNLITLINSKDFYIGQQVPASLAVDIAPYYQYQLHGDDKLQWDDEDPVWQELGLIGKSIGLKWGGDWGSKDMAHFQASWI